MLKFILLLMGSLFVVSCGNFIKPKHQQAPSASNDVSNVGSGVAFAEVRDKIFVPHCVKCHIQYGDYDFVKPSLTSIVSSIEENRMPKGGPPITEDLKVLLRSWVSGGAPNEATASAPTTPPIDENVLQPTWASLSRNIFIPKCAVCHNPTGQAPWVDVSSRPGMAKTFQKHINFKNPEESNLIVRLADPEEPMPPLPPDSNIPQLTEEEIQVVVEWIKAGIP